MQDPADKPAEATTDITADITADITSSITALPDTEVNSVDFDETHGLNRRQFMFISLATAASATLGATAATSVRAQTRGGGAGGRGGGAGAPQTFQQAPPLPLGNAEPPALQFQPYVGGTAALIQKLVNERGWSSFERAQFPVEKWSGTVPTSDEDIAFLPAHRLASLISERKLTATRLTDIYLKRIERYNPTLNFAVTVMADQARREAAQADAEIAAGRYRGPLHGLPYGLKDLFAVKGVRTTWGAKDFENRVIDTDAEIVVRLREAGAILVAKLATGLFAQNDWWFGGRTNNPWNPDVGSSGSSAGPGSATAAGCVAFAIGTETQGSIVSPSVRNGICGLRPTFGRVSRYGGMVLSWSMDRIGPMARSVEDCAMVFNAIHGIDEKDPSTITTPFHFDPNINLGSLRIGVDPNAPPELVDKLRELGMKPVAVGPRPTVAGLNSGLNVEYSAAFEDYVERKAQETGFDLTNIPVPAAGRGRGAGGGGRGGGAGAGGGGVPATPASCMAPADWNPRFVTGRTTLAYQFMQSQRRRYALVAAWAEYMKDLDMFIGAPMADVGPNAQTGHPCVVLPYKFDRLASVAGSCPPAKEGWENAHQPICAVIVGNLYEDDKILAAAHQFQKATDFHLRRPSLI